jgi:hypothetical protein
MTNDHIIAGVFRVHLASPTKDAISCRRANRIGAMRLRQFLRWLRERAVVIQALPFGLMPRLSIYCLETNRPRLQATGVC